MPYCENCGYEYVEGIPVCPDCRMPLVEGERYTCESCGETILKGAEFCPHCGTMLQAGKDAPVASMCATHPKNKATGRCVFCGKLLCEECVVRENGKMFCTNDEHVKMAFNWAVAVHTNTEYEAQMIKANLEGAGIDAVVLSQGDRMFFTTMGDLAVTEVMVPRMQLEEAKKIIRAIELDQSENPPNKDS